MAAKRHTSISRNTLATRKKRNSRRALDSPNSDSLDRTYRSKTPQPPAPNKKREKRKKKKNKILQYRARKDSGSQQEIEEELPDYVRATTPQPHLFNTDNRITIKRSKSGTNVHSMSSSRSPQNDIPTFSPMDVAARGPGDNSMFTFVKQQFEPHMASNAMNQFSPVSLPPMQIIPSNNTTPIPMIHNQLPPHNDDEFNTTKIHQIPKPPPSLQARPRADSAQSTASMTPEFGALLSPKQMEAQILSHYNEASKKKQRKKSKETPRKKSKMQFLSKIKETKPKKRKSKKRNSNSSRSRSNSKPFNDEDYTEEQPPMKKETETEQIFTNKLHPAYTPFAAPKSTPTQRSHQWKNIPQITPNHPALVSFETPHSYINNKDIEDRNRSFSGPSEHVTPYPLNDRHHKLHQHMNRPHSKRLHDYEEENEFLDDQEVAAKAFAFDQSLRKQGHDHNEHDHKQQEYDREVDKIRFKCDQLDWNLNTLQSNTDKDIRQITAKMHRVEHDIKTQNELFNRRQYYNSNKRRNSIFNSLESSIGAVMRNVESIKDALQTLDLRMSIINQRQHDIFKHIDETKDIVDNLDSVTISSKGNNNEESASSGATPLVLNALEDRNNLISSSRRASLQSMSEMLRLRSMSVSVKDTSEYEMYNNINDNNPLILPTYDDNEDILHPESVTKKKLMGHIRPELLIQHNSKQRIHNVPCMISQRAQTKPLRLVKDKSHDMDLTASMSDDYGIVIERTITQQLARRMSDVDGNRPQNINKLPSIVEHHDDDESSAESELSLEINNDDNNALIDDEKQASFPRRKHNKHIRSSIDSGLSDNIMSQLQCETMLIHSSNESEEEDLFEIDAAGADDEKAIEHNKEQTTQGMDIDEEKQYIINKENRRKSRDNEHTKRPSHSRNIEASVNANSVALDHVDMKTLQVPITNKMTPNNNRKYSESYSLNIYASHIKNTPTENKIMEHQIMDKQRTASMSYDIGKEATLTYEREISRNDMDPLGLKDRTQTNGNNDDDDDENDSVSDLSVDSMSDLSADGDDTFVVHSDTLQKALATQQMEQDHEEKKEDKTVEKQHKKMIQLMNTNFILHIVPNTFRKINNFIINTLSDKPSYILTICNNTTSHDLFFKTSKIYSCKSNKSLILFKECSNNMDDIINDDVIVIDNDDSDDHLAPTEHMTFGDINIKKGIRYAGYFVYEAYPFPNTGNDSDGDRSRQPSVAITPNYKTNPITPHLKPHAILNAIDEKHKYDAPGLQFAELNLSSMSPSTVNKYRRQSLSTSSRRTSVRRMSAEPSVTSLLGRALDEENNANYPWNDDFDDLIDIVIGFDIQLSVGDPELNSFKCYLQFSEYAQPTHYQTQLANRKLLKSFCNGGADGLHISHDKLVANININHKHSIHPQMIANIAYNKHMVTEPETFDID